MISQRNCLILSLLCLPVVACGDDKGGTDTDTSVSGPTVPSTGETPASSTGDASDTPGASTDVPGSSTGIDTIEPTTDPSTTTDGTSTGDPGGTSSEGGDSTTGELLGPSWEADVFPKFVLMQCDCHTQGSGGLKMTSAMDSYMNLVGVKSDDTALNRIEPGDPDASYLWHKILGTQGDVGGAGQAMPLGGSPLPQDIVDLIEEWIVAGAQP